MKGQTQGHTALVCESKSVPDCPTETSRPRPLASDGREPTPAVPGDALWPWWQKKTRACPLGV